MIKESVSAGTADQDANSLIVSATHGCDARRYPWI